MSNSSLAARPARHAALPAKRQSKQQWPIVIIAMLGVLIFTYPMTARWFNDRSLSGDVTGYVGAVETVTSQERQELLRQALQFNQDLPGGPLRDPYALAEDGSVIAVEDIGEEYYRQLAVPGTSAMARLTIPEISVDLPIYHGTDDDTLMKGVGHLFGSALPVGGPGTHSVLTAHSGLPSATMFNDLEDLTEGDTFHITLLGEVLTYRVDQIAVVLPDEARLLEAEQGKDFVTLITCTPIGVNTHRVLVRGERIETPPSTTMEQVVPGHGIDPGFPWWIVAISGGFVASLGLGFMGGRGKREVSTTSEVK